MVYLACETLLLGGDAYVWYEFSLGMKNEHRSTLPDLKIFAVFEGDCVQPFKLLQKIFLQFDQNVCSVKPGVLMNN